MEHKVGIKDLKITFDNKVVYDPLPQQKKFHMSPAKYRLMGGSAGGGKSYAIIGESIMRSLKYDFPLVGAIFRRSYPELESTIIRTMLNVLPNWFYKYNQSQHILTLKNGSMIEFCYSESDNDVTRYQSREWDWIGIDEVTHFSEYQFTYLMSRLRTTKPINTKFFAATNPGGRGHNFVKERWVTKSCDNENYKASDYDFIPAGVLENPYIMKANPDYIENLKMLPDLERRALLEGDWDLFAGMFFTEWSPTRHIVEDFEVPESWQLILGWDDGTREPRAVHLYAVDNDQRVWCVWEYYEKEENLSVAAENIRRKLQELGYWDRIYKLVVDPSMKRTDSQTGMSSVEILEGMGFGFKIGEVELGNNSRVEGWRVMKTYMSHKPYEEPMWKVFKSCSNMIRTIPQLTYYQSRSAIGLKKEDLNTAQDDHCADNARYVLMSLNRLPSRFESSTSVKIAKRKYTPNSSYS
jgi:phage terminase large subunit